MSVSREEVIHSYRHLLGRDPESEAVIQEKMRNHHSLRGLVEAMVLSAEFRLKNYIHEHAELNSDCSEYIRAIDAEIERKRTASKAPNALIALLKRPISFSTPEDDALLRRIIVENVPRHWKIYLFAFAMTFVVSGCTSMVAFLIGSIVDATFLSRDVGAVFMLSFVWIGLFMVRGLAIYGQDISLARAANRITAMVQKRIFSRLLQQGVGYFADRRSTEFMTNAVMGAGAFANILNQLVLAIGRDAFTIVFLIFFMVIKHPLMSLVGLGVLPLALFGVEKLVLRAREIAVTQFVGAERILGTMQEVVHGFRVVKAFRLEGLLTRRVDRSVDDLERASNNLAKVSNWSSPLIESFGGIAIGLACLYSGYQVLAANAVPGEFVSFMLAFIMLFDPARRLARLKIDLGGSLVMAQSLYQLFDTVPSEADDERLPPMKVGAGRVEFSHVDFAYHASTPVLRDLSFVAEPGRITALVGLSGGGKTTTFNLLLRFYEIAKGTITIDGQDVSKVSRASLRDQISYVGQDVYLFEGTIRDNILLGRPDATEEDLVEACRAAYAHDFIVTLSKGYDSPVGEFGSKLSLGQRQRISIARALLKNAPIVLLDEPTASLDAESEHFVQMAIRRLCAGKTTLAIAHRLNTIDDADCIHVLEDGTVVESGRHEALMAANGRYATFFNLQFGTTEPSPSDA